MSCKKILHVVGARPNFMKIAPLMAAMSRKPGDFEQFLVHTGQHYDDAMSDVFFRELAMPEPNVNLGVGSGSHAQQTGQVMLRFEQVLTPLGLRQRHLPHQWRLQIRIRHAGRRRNRLQESRRPNDALPM